MKTLQMMLVSIAQDFIIAVPGVKFDPWPKSDINCELDDLLIMQECIILFNNEVAITVGLVNGFMNPK